MPDLQHRDRDGDDAGAEHHPGGAEQRQPAEEPDEGRNLMQLHPVPGEAEVEEVVDDDDMIVA